MPGVGYKPTQHARLQIPSEPEPSTHGGTRPKMFCSRCVVPLLVVYMLLEDSSAASMPRRSRNRRRVSGPEQELQTDLTEGETSQLSGPETFLTPTEPSPVPRQNQNQNRGKAKGKRRKVPPLDSIGSSQLSSFRNRQDEPEIHQEEYKK